MSLKLTSATGIGSVAAALMASSCCWLPFCLAFLGLSGMGLAVILEPWRAPLLFVSFLGLATGFYWVYFRSRSRHGNRTAKAALWIATLMTATIAITPEVFSRVLDLDNRSGVLGSFIRIENDADVSCPLCVDQEEGSYDIQIVRVGEPQDSTVQINRSRR